MGSEAEWRRLTLSGVVREDLFEVTYEQRTK